MWRLVLLITIPALPLVVAGCGEGLPQGEYHTLTPTGSDTDREGPESSQSTADLGSNPAAAADVESEDQPDGGPIDTDPGVTLVAAEVDSAAVNAVEPDSEQRKPAVEPLVPEPEFRRERGGALRVTFDDLDLNRVIGIDRPTVDTPADLPPWFGDLEGRRIRVRGFMKPFEFSTGLIGFTFVRDNGVCCFGPMAKLYDKIQVRLREGTSTDFIDNKPFDVEGVFRIEPTGFRDELLYFYHLDDAIILR